MSHIPLVERPAEDRVEAVFADIEDELGGVPSLFLAFGHHPDMLETTWKGYKAVMIHGVLSPQLKEGIGLAISADNHCDYGIYHYSATLQELGVEVQEVMRIRTNPKHVHYSDKEHALFDLARRANKAPSDHGEHLIAEAQKLGARDDEIVEALAVMELVLGFNHFADVLGLEPHRDR
ncbi:carboxymuconolactone decarboxylase family protein [Microbulbifer taiwanensis]|uniref:Carboxymuconolactone decarboxylase family protein n=1 Tax=Microbulbifer taiwanensis TaxID=986746 RepID=A0ABW1YR27_9GAMM|nr:carboxymuconolactone decarboxylase family protein [Microbulbifer taiwanensis]